MSRMTRCLFGDGFSMRNEGRWDGPLGLPLTFISLYTLLPSNHFYPPRLLLPSSPPAFIYRPLQPLLRLSPQLAPYLSRPPPLINLNHTLAPFPHCALSPPLASLHPPPHYRKHLAQFASHRPPLYIRTHLLGVLFLGASIAPQTDIHASTPRQRWVF